MTHRPTGSRVPVAVALLLALLLAGGFTGLAAAQDATPIATPASGEATPAGSATIEPAECAAVYTLPEGVVDGEDVTCGYMAVPAFAGDMGSPMLRLFTMRFAATGSDPAAEPLVILTGGPGQSMGSLLPLFVPPTDQQPISFTPLLERQDVVLIDQRGTGASEPALLCVGDVVPGRVQPPMPGGTPAATPAATPAGTPAVIQLPDAEQLGQLSAECPAAYAAHGIDLTAFTTENSAADIAALVGALGVPQVDLYGISYGSFLGERVITRYPDLIRSATLTSIVAPDTDILLRQITGFDEALTDIFALCAADEVCAAANPDPEAALAAAYERLTATPYIAEIADPASGQTFQVEINGEAFLSLVYLLTFTSQPYGVPPLATSVAAGDDSLLADLAPIAVQGGGLASGLLTTMYCQDFWQDIDIDQALSQAGVRPVLAEGFTSSWESQAIACQALALPQAPADEDAVDSDVPTLLVSGGLDPITPPGDAQPVLDGLSAGQEFTIEDIGHDPLTSIGPCGFGILSDFIAAPDEPVNASCTLEITLDMSPDFIYGDAAATPGATPGATPAA